MNENTSGAAGALDAAIEGAVGRALAAQAEAALAPIIRAILREELVAVSAGEMVDAEEAARILGMSRKALHRAVERGRPPVEPIRMGRRLRWRRADLIPVAAGRRERRVAGRSGGR